LPFLAGEEEVETAPEDIAGELVISLAIDSNGI
jgi:hypothetical protein